jgi:hypothetical protein
MSGQSLDAEASETVAGVVRLLRRAAELVWVAIDTDTAGFPRRRRGAQPPAGCNSDRRAGTGWGRAGQSPTVC